MKILLNIDTRDKAYILTYRNKFLREHEVKASSSVLHDQDLKKLKESFDVVLCGNSETCKELTGDAVLDHWRGGRWIEEDYPPVVFINPLKQMYTVSYGEWLHEQDVKKIRETIIPDAPFNWKYTDNPAEVHAFFEYNQPISNLMAFDIETTKRNKISCMGYTFQTTKPVEYYTLVVHGIDTPEMLEVLRYWHERNKVPVITSNGMFDMMYMMLYRMPMRNWFLDTEYLWASWQAELPKSLAFQASIFLHDYQYWKEGRGARAHDLWKYNARDCQNTLRIWRNMLHDCPSWAVEQYIQKFRRAIPAMYANFEGFLVDTKKLEGLRWKAENENAVAKDNLVQLMGDINFNSPTQVAKVLYDDMGVPTIKGKRSTDELSLIKLAATRGGEVAEISTSLIEYRKSGKAISTYYDAELVNDRLMYSLRIDGTETDRMSCTQAAIYGTPNEKGKYKNIGAQLQNIPWYMKSALIADPGWMVINADYGQADAFGTAYLSQDENMIQALLDPSKLLPYGHEIQGDEDKDFYCYVIANLFGKYIKKSKDETSEDYKLRQFQKKIMHGSNYLMGAGTLVESAIKELGFGFIQECMEIVGYRGQQINFVKQVLNRLDNMFPKRKRWWAETVYRLKINNRILETPDGWKRIFHGDLDSHGVMRSAVAHQPQHLTVVGINQAFTEVYYEYKELMRLKGQVHDSVIVQARKENVDEAVRVLHDLLYQPIVIHGREMWLPVEISVGESWGDMTEVKV